MAGVISKSPGFLKEPDGCFSLYKEGLKETSSYKSGLATAVVTAIITQGGFAV